MPYIISFVFKGSTTVFTVEDFEFTCVKHFVGNKAGSSRE